MSALRTRSLLPLVLLASCGGGANTSSGAVWVDAAGHEIAVVEVASGLRYLAFVDNKDLVWHVDPWTGQTSTAIDAVNIGWDNASCTGQSFLLDDGGNGGSSPLPGFTFRVAGDDAVHVRPDGLATKSVAICAHAGPNGGCRGFACDAEKPLVPLEGTRPAPGIEIPPAMQPPLRPMLAGK